MYGASAEYKLSMLEHKQSLKKGERKVILFSNGNKFMKCTKVQNIRYQTWWNLPINKVYNIKKLKYFLSFS